MAYEHTPNGRYISRFGQTLAVLLPKQIRLGQSYRHIVDIRMCIDCITPQVLRLADVAGPVNIQHRTRHGWGGGQGAKSCHLSNFFGHCDPPQWNVGQ